MNHESRKTLNITFTGTMSIGHNELEQFIKSFAMCPPALAEPRIPARFEYEGRLPRLAFSVEETAEILGISQSTVYGLMQRGLLRSSLALRNKIISKTEIERFLKETTSAVL